MSENKRNAAGPQPGQDYDAATGEFFSADELRQQEPQLDQRTYRRMLTMATIDAQPERCNMVKPPQTIPIVLWKGIINGVCDLTDPENPARHYTGLVGEFEATVYRGIDPMPSPDGETLTWYGGIAILPGGWQEAILSQIARVDPEILTTKGHPFAYEFAASPASNPRKYSYVARNMMRVVQRHDRLSMLGIEAQRVRQLRLGAPIIDAGSLPEGDR